jgi:hypothetical protein
LPNFADWWFLFKRSVKTTEKQSLAETCEIVLNSMWFLEDKIAEKLRKKGDPLDPCHSFVLAYFRRNIVYLQSTYILSSMGFIHPSINLQRTVYETMLRSYFFIVNPKEANQYYAHLRTDEEEKFLKSRKRYSQWFLADKLFKSETKDAHRLFYKHLCISAHAEIKGLLKDFPKYDEKGIEDNLKVVLSLSYGNIQVVSEAFLELYDESLKKFIKEILVRIAQLTKSKPAFEPDKDRWASKLRFTKSIEI